MICHPIGDKRLPLRNIQVIDMRPPARHLSNSVKVVPSIKDVLEVLDKVRIRTDLSGNHQSFSQAWVG